MSFPSLNSTDQSKFTAKAGKEKQVINPFPSVYMLNRMVNAIKDLDIHTEYVDLIDVSLQKMGDGGGTFFV